MSEKLWLKVLSSSIHGKGLFASRDIKKGTVIGVCETRPIQPTQKNGPYTMALGDGSRVDVTCRLKYINHSKNPNVAYINRKKDRGKSTVQAMSDISAGEELVHDYGDIWPK